MAFCRCVPLLFVIAFVSACGTSGRSGGGTSATLVSDGPLYRRSLVEQCLVKRHVVASSSPSSVMRPYIRRVKALTGGIQIISGPIKGLPGPPVDAGNVLFLTNSLAAKSEQQTLADIFLFHKGEPDSVRVFFPPPPTKKAAESVQRVARNVIVFWQWPRQQPVSSNRIINACLAKALR